MQAYTHIQTKYKDIATHGNIIQVTPASKTTVISNALHAHVNALPHNPRNTFSRNIAKRHTHTGELEIMEHVATSAEEHSRCCVQIAAGHTKGANGFLSCGAQVDQPLNVIGGKLSPTAATTTTDRGRLLRDES